ncbi:hypothetical protein DPMN_174707 [Dreissena polymorpha]|uniref:Uncharacterized protein n=1 Tax=Dreissena polymorpha TaxID=45954 RepID=A0A9D4E570_DREPO|nr:hypothetical protein DPMN_174707 [Dreissena polymorpha]
MAKETLMCTGRHFKDNSCMVVLKRARLLRKGSSDNLKMLFLLLARCATFMATPDVTGRRLDPQDGFSSTLSV